MARRRGRRQRGVEVKQWALVASGIGLSALFLWIAFRNVELPDLMASFRLADFRWLLLYPVLATVLNVIRSEIWRLLLRKRVSVADAFWGYSVGFLVNNVMPLRMGEAARIGVLARRRRLPIVEVAAAAGIERVLDMFSVVLILAVALPLTTGTRVMQHAAVLAALVTAVVIAGIVLVVLFGEALEPLVERVLTRVVATHAGAFVRRWREFHGALAVMREPAIALPAVIGALSVWALTVVLQWTVMRAFQPSAGLIDAALLIGVVSIASAVPAAPGSIGTYQLVAQQALTLPFPALYTMTSALAIALVSHATSYVYSSILGVLGLWYFGVSLSAFTPGSAVEDGGAAA
jgi:uncharacterized protein (TIRG00374 family)